MNILRFPTFSFNQVWNINIYLIMKRGRFLWDNLMIEPEKVYAIMVFSSRYLYTQTLVNFLDNFNETYKSLSLNVINLTIFIDPSKQF